MKKLLILIAAITFTAISTNSQAQIKAFPQSTGGTIDGYSLPKTVLHVEIHSQREVVLRGPYARYASQYLGIIGAPQSDKESYQLLGAKIQYSEEPDPSSTFIFDSKTGTPLKAFQWLTMTPHINNTILSKDNDYQGASIIGDNPFKDVGATIYQGASNSGQVDRLSSGNRDMESLASEAASTIFKLRKKRIELICAEQGENVFGAGLESALKEIKRLEKEYLSLFIGKRYVQTFITEYPVVPKKGETRAVVCRFTPEKGVTNSMDLSASPVMIEFKPETNSAAPMIAPKSSRSAMVRIPTTVNMQVSFSGQTLCLDRAPIYQLAQTITVPVL